MKRFSVYLSFAVVGLLILSAAVASFWAQPVSAGLNSPLQSAAQPLTQDEKPAVEQAPDAPVSTLVQSYSAKYVCTEALSFANYWLQPKTPLVTQETDILIHNPNDFPVQIFIKATDPAGVPTPYKGIDLAPDNSMKIDCSDIYNMLSLPVTPAPGLNLHGFVVIQIGPQLLGSVTRYAPLDVTAEYVRGSEVLKKDIHFQPWWVWWPWQLPWRLGYPYMRLVPYFFPSTPDDPNAPDQFEYPIDCNEYLLDALEQDVYFGGVDPGYIDMTINALNTGFTMYQDVMARRDISASIEPALVPIIGKCDKVTINEGGIDRLYMNIDYVIFSNKSPHEFPGPAVNPNIMLPPPWIPGIWYDLPAVTQQNVSMDIDDFFVQWHSQRWIEAGLPQGVVDNSMPYFFPYWCGWGYWAWWWNGGSCTNIGVGEGESLDVEQITPVRLVMSIWPPLEP